MTVPLALNQFTVPGIRLDELAVACRTHGVSGLGVLRATMDELGVHEVRRILARNGVQPTSVCVITGLVAASAARRRELFADATRTLEVATELGVPAVVVTGGPRGGLNYRDALGQAADALAGLDERAGKLGGRLLLEPLHPMLAVHSAVTSLRQAAALAGSLTATGLVLDVWHVWAEYGLTATISEHAALIDIVHLADWIDNAEPVTDRELPGDGIADVAWLCRHIAAAITDRAIWWEIEVLSDRLATRYGQREFAGRCISRTRAMLGSIRPEEERGAGGVMGLGGALRGPEER
jgi:sugar phosphate isomerase/epimerase